MEWLFGYNEKLEDVGEMLLASHYAGLFRFRFQPTRRSRNRKKKKRKKKTQARAQPRETSSLTDISAQWSLPAITEDVAEVSSSDKLTRVDTILLAQNYPAPPSAPE